MLIELSITPLGRGTHLSKDLADILKIIDDSHVRYCLTPFGTCLEAEWAEMMAIDKRCHDQARSGIAGHGFARSIRVTSTHLPFTVIFEWHTDLLDHIAGLAQGGAILPDLKELRICGGDVDRPPFNFHWPRRELRLPLA